MSKPLIKDEVIVNKKTAIQQLNRLLERYINSPVTGHLKKANLLSYWLKDYARFISFEERFNPKLNISYKRGDIIKVGFGFNVGKEYGGRHYAVVLDNKNDHSSETITVIPLTSIKETSPNRRHNVSLGNEIYKLLKLKCETTLRKLTADLNKHEETRVNFEKLLELAEQNVNAVEGEPGSPEFKEHLTSAVKTVNQTKEMLDELNKQLNDLNEMKDEATKLLEEIIGMKQGSIALVGQITTISKVRIYDPKKSGDVLAGISLSEENMDKINSKVKELFVFEKNC